MGPSIMLQSWAISRRYFTSFLRAPFTSLVRVVLWPTILLAIIANFLITNSDDTQYLKSMQIEKFIPFVVLITTGFHIWSFTEYIVTDRSIGMKSLMISMGLKRKSWYFGYLLCMLLVLLPIILTISTLSTIFVFVETKTYIFTIYLIYLLFFIHITGMIFAFASIIPSPTACFLVILFLLTEAGLQLLLVYVLGKVEVDYYGILMFIASLSPYMSLRIFCDSYTHCKHHCGIGFVKVENQTLIYQPIYLTILNLVLWSAISYIFARWFEEVCPWQNDTARKGLCFCIQRSFNGKSYNTLNEIDENHNPKYFERVQDNSRAVGIYIRKVTKKFNNLLAVNDLSLNIYKGETTLLLGHNGAGKTTLMNIILGKLSQDDGCVDLQKSSSNCIGVCPQTSVLDQNLTVQQHLQLFVDIKSSNLTTEQKRDHVKKTIQDVSLENHIYKLPDDLSGGMKRKLSLAMAFVGQSDILILDEPSSGLDPDSRVFIWDAIRNYRKDRTVLLSTQHMEEADYLGDRIAIMAQGKIICCGSSIFLNNVLGDCYKLRVECLKSKEDQVLTFVHKYFPTAKQLGPIRTHESVSEMIVELSGDKKSQDLEQRLIDMLEFIESNPTKSHNIKSFGLKSSSIEDVMHNTIKIRENEGSSVDNNQTRLTIASTNDLIEKMAKASRQQHTSNYETQKSILSALLIKQIQTYKRDWKSLLLFRVVVPLWIIFGMMRDLSSFVSFSPTTSQAFLIFHFIYYPTVERVTKFKTMQLTSFASPTIYWLSHFITDFASVIFMAISMNILHVLTFDGIYESSQLTIHVILTTAMILFGVCATFIAYILSTIFRDSKACIGYHILLYCMSLIVYITIKLLSMVTLRDLSWLNNITDNLFMFLLPSDAMQYVLTGLTTKCYIRTILTIDYCNGSGSSELMESVSTKLSPVYVGLSILCAQIIAYYLLLTYIEYMNFELGWYFRYQNMISIFKRSSCSSSGNNPSIPVDEDVVSESSKASVYIKPETSKDRLSLVACGLEKSYIYSKKVINELSFTVGKGECFGLLGVNGAGKSTTFSMLASELKPDDGQIWAINEYNFNKYRKDLGYDPQSEPETSLNSTEALYLMARLRRLDESCISEVVLSVLDILQMNEHATKTARELSGGTKRKLALGMSLIGNPKLAILDEPTAGVDPLARQDVWSLLRSLRSKNKASIVISSHAMEECEAVCDRIAIMARGKLRCIGTFLHLRSKFSQGCRLKIQLSNTNDYKKFMQIVNEIDASLQRTFGHLIKLVDTNVNSATFNIADNSVKRSSLFKILRQYKQKNPNLYYIINDSSLEDIFIALAKEEQMLEVQAKVSRGSTVC